MLTRIPIWSRSSCNSRWKQIREVVYGLAVGCRENVHVKQFGGRNGAVTKPPSWWKASKDTYSKLSAMNEGLKQMKRGSILSD